jgi:hypothetical protein
MGLAFILNRAHEPVDLVAVRVVWRGLNKAFEVLGARADTPRFPQHDQPFVVERLAIGFVDQGSAVD